MDLNQKEIYLSQLRELEQLKQKGTQDKENGYLSKYGSKQSNGDLNNFQFSHDKFVQSNSENISQQVDVLKQNSFGENYQVSQNQRQQQSTQQKKNLTIDTYQQSGFQNKQRPYTTNSFIPFSATNQHQPILQGSILNGNMTAKNQIQQDNNQISINNQQNQQIETKNNQKYDSCFLGLGGSSQTTSHSNQSHYQNINESQMHQKNGAQANHSRCNSTNNSKIVDPKYTVLPNSNSQNNQKNFGVENSKEVRKSFPNKNEIENKTNASNNTNNQSQQQQFFEDKNAPLPNHEPTKCSFKRNGIVKAYAANTNQGLVRNYNEDRVSIILNIMKPASRANEEWPKCSFFGIYDGHGGVSCADFLRDNLHQYVIRESSFPWNPKEALKNGFAAAEKKYIEIASNSIKSGQIDRSGSCAIVVLIVGDMCYVANVGDSRAVLSGDSGAKTYTLSRDHKPGDELEQKRIVQGGGKIYQTQATNNKINPKTNQQQIILGPLRVYPGRLSVSRTFGDIEAKIEELGGNPNVVICEPEIKSFKIQEEHDFIVLACDGIFDKLSSREVIQTVWEESKLQVGANIHKHCGLGVENILRKALNQRSLDNVTVVMICFNNFKKKIFGEKKEDKEKSGNQIKGVLTNNFVQNSQGEKREVLQETTQNYRSSYNQQQQQVQQQQTSNVQQSGNSHSGLLMQQQQQQQQIMQHQQQQIQQSQQLLGLQNQNQANSLTNTPQQQSGHQYSKSFSKKENINIFGNQTNKQEENNEKLNQQNSSSISNQNYQGSVGGMNNVRGSYQIEQKKNSVLKENILLRNSTNNCSDQLSKLKLLDQKIHEISSKVNQFSLYDNSTLNQQKKITPANNYNRYE